MDQHLSSHQVFNAGTIVLESGRLLENATIAYRQYGELNAERTNAIIFMTPFGATHTDIEWMIGCGNALDPDRYSIIIPNQFANGLSSSPAENSGDEWPDITIADNVRAQRRLLREVLSVERVALACGWSMGGLQAYHWATLFPHEVQRMAVICGAAQTSPHNIVFLDSVKAALTADPNYRAGRFLGTPELGLRAVGHIFASWVMSPQFYRQETWRCLGYTSREDYVAKEWETRFLNHNPANLLSHIWTWQHADISAHPQFNGNLESALASIQAKGLLLPGETDLFFRKEDNAAEALLMKDVRLMPIPSIWGHRAGMNTQHATDVKFVNDALKTLLSE